MPPDDPHVRADWGRVEGIYRQFRRIVEDPQATYLPVVIPGSLAQALGRVSTNYAGHEAEFADHVRTIFTQIEGDNSATNESLLRLYFDDRLISAASPVGGVRFTAYNPPGSQRRRSTPLEAAIETCRRLRDLDSLMHSLRAAASCAAVLGGSLGYGRFMNVRGANWGKIESAAHGEGAQHLPLAPTTVVSEQWERQDGSDIDLLVVLNNYADLDPLCDSLDGLPGAMGTDIAAFRDRVDAFRRLDPPPPRMFSHKLPLWTSNPDPLLLDLGLAGTYILSMHIFSRSDFEVLLLDEHPILSFGGSDDHTVSMSDFRPNSPDQRSDQQRSFAGSELRLERPFENVEYGFLARSAVCVVKGGRYYPGMYQNLILPMFEMIWDDFPNSLSSRIHSFRWKIIERLRAEKHRWPNEKLRLSLSHTRSELFAPHVVLALDEGRIL